MKTQIKSIGECPDTVQETIVPSTYTRVGFNLYKWCPDTKQYIWVFKAQYTNITILTALYENALKEQ